MPFLTTVFCYFVNYMKQIAFQTDLEKKVKFILENNWKRTHQRVLFMNVKHRIWMSLTRTENKVERVWAELIH